MRKIAILLSLAAMSSNASAQQSRYLTGREILGSFSGHTMLWEDRRTPEKPAAVVHYSTTRELSVLYDGQIVPNDFVFDGGGTIICWRQKTVCRSFLYEGSHVYVVNPNSPDEVLAEVTRVTEDRDGTVFEKIAQAELDHQSAPVVAETPSEPEPVQDEPPQANHGHQLSASDAVLMAAIVGILIYGASSSGSSDSSGDRCIQNGIDQCKINDNLIRQANRNRGD